MTATRLRSFGTLAGVAELCAAIAEHQRRCYGIEVDPGTASR